MVPGQCSARPPLTEQNGEISTIDLAVPGQVSRALDLRTRTPLTKQYRQVRAVDDAVPTDVARAVRVAEVTDVIASAVGEEARDLVWHVGADRGVRDHGGLARLEQATAAQPTRDVPGDRTGIDGDRRGPALDPTTITLGGVALEHAVSNDDRRRCLGMPDDVDATASITGPVPGELAVVQ